MRFWQRVADVKDTPDKVDFFLKTRVIEPPFVVSFGADPHGNLWDNWSYTMPQEIERAGNMVHLGMLLGDLTYAQLDSAEVVFPHFEKYAREFPVSFLHVFGNHDHVGGPPDNELVGHGAFDKFLNPKRLSFDVAGIHVMILDYWFLNQQGVDWAEASRATPISGRFTPTTGRCTSTATTTNSWIGTQGVGATTSTATGWGGVAAGSARFGRSS